MTITPWMVYVITRLDGIVCVACCSCFLFGGITSIGFLLGIGFPDDECGWHPSRARMLYVSVPLFILSVLGAIAIPNQKEAAAIYLIPKIANNERIQQIPSKVLSLADQWLDELRPKKESK